MSQQKTPLVSIFVITYRHERFIAQCLDSLVGQVTNFDFRVVLGEDCSPDGTRAICEEYAARYPHIIDLLPATENLGAVRNGMRTLKACTGKYIAMCEGDDYWCDMHKLQKQVDLLEADPSVSLCFSSVHIQDDIGWNKPYDHYFTVLDTDTVTIEDVIRTDRNIIPTPTILFRRSVLPPQPYPPFFEYALMGDIPIQLFATHSGVAKAIPGPLAVYRDHEGGKTKTRDVVRKGEEALLALLNGFNEYTGHKYDKALNRKYHEMAKTDLIFGSRELRGMARFRNYLRYFPQYLKYAEKVNLREVVYYHILLFAPGLLRLAGKK
ncbi:hypothetical protein GCM10023093_03900 [Nemorincola caseinilytica]|uniref:Glycosyltransferase 2-like domain-containing protein n=1 Tax=Nemorincola caseinilytica TaxID=2054315 RepID=A0ABP8N748_9BACT